MNLRNLSIAVALALLALFALLNWTAFTTPTRLSLVFAQVQAPLGLIMLVITGFLCALFLIYLVFQQAGVIVEARRYAKELQSHRELADQAEASRFTELRQFVDSELRRIEAQSAAGFREVVARLEQVQQQFQDKLSESTLTLSAYIGEVDDKLDRALGLSADPISRDPAQRP